MWWPSARAAAAAAQTAARRAASTTPAAAPSDTLAVGLLVTAFRARGHLHAKLDPLARPPGGRGVWLGEDADAAARAAEHADPLLSRVLAALDAGAPATLPARLAAALGLKGGPAAAAGATFDFHGAPLAAGAPGGRAEWRLPALATHLAHAYCGTLTAELDHLPPAAQAWLAARLEALPAKRVPLAARRTTLATLARCAAFETYLASAFPSSKRFGIEGLDALAPGVAAACARVAAAGVTRLQVGTPHRGRLTLLATVFGTPAGQIMAEMEADQSAWHVGDVKYHLGKGASVDVGANQPLHVSVAPNPSHLEAVGPVVLGMVRAQQAALGATSVAPLLIHGDAAFAGLGVAAETLAMARVPGFDVGGTIHIVCNNQVGFTTAPGCARSGPHPTDVARAAGAPILHANADDPDAVVAACALAADWRCAWGRDAVVDVVGYRRRGHNELDDAVAAAPLTAAAIATHPHVLDVYSSRLVGDGIVDAGAASALAAAASAALDDDFASFKRGAYTQTAADWLAASWQGDALAALAAGPASLGPHGVRQRTEPTGLPVATLAAVGVAACTPPPAFTLAPAAADVLAKRVASLTDSSNSAAPDRRRIDFATAEALTFGSLALRRGGGAAAAAAGLASLPAAAGLNVGAYSVRLVGQDAERGTFNQRHAGLRDAVTGARALPLAAVAARVPGAPGQQPVEVWNSPLNEAAVLSFEYGYSLGAAGRALVVWEAQVCVRGGGSEKNGGCTHKHTQHPTHHHHPHTQFGDFANNAQTAIDVFVAAAEERWGQQSGLVLLLPHGFDGGGPDHSSARLERFLALCNDDGDALPGDAARERAEAAASFAALSAAGGGGVTRAAAADLLAALGAGGDDAGAATAALWAEAGVDAAALLQGEDWAALMRRYLRRNAEARANMFVVSPSTPAQLFHVLRRQLNRPYAKPLVVAAPKRLHHHGPATSALADCGPGTAFTRVIDDGGPADNTRHRAANPETGECVGRVGEGGAFSRENGGRKQKPPPPTFPSTTPGAPYNVPPTSVRRLLLCSGQVFYSLTAARRSRRTRDVALARVEQLSPFPYDRVAAVADAYPSAEIVWVQEEPKNQGPWLHVAPRVNTALRELATAKGEGGAPRTVRYVGRPPAGTTATASVAIHREELKSIVDAALSDDLAPMGAENMERRV